MDTVEEGEMGPSKGNKQLDRFRTIGVGGPAPWTIERKPRWPKYVALLVLGHPYWRLMVCPSRLMPRLGIIAGGMLA